MTMLVAENLSKSYRHFSLIGAGERKSVLHDVSLTVSEGETVALLGRSGCGKSTLARLLCGLETPDSGAVRYQGQSLSQLDRKQKHVFRKDLQMVFQDSPSAVNPRFNIRSIIAEPLRYLSNEKREEREERVRELLELVELPVQVADRLPTQISGGQLQRVCIARALAPRPKLVILDEAVSNLDIHLQASALKLLKRLQQHEGVAYLFVTHDMRLVRRFATRVIVMEDGTIVEECSSGSMELLQHPASVMLKASVLPPMPRILATSSHHP